MKFKKNLLLTVLIIGLSVSNLFSQPADPPENPNSNPVVGSGGEDPVDIPIDGGAALFVIAGLAYGVRKFRKKNNKD